MRDRATFEIHPLTPEEVPAVLDLLRESFGDAGVEWTEEIWRWKHLQNPFGVSSGLLARAEGRPVALRVFLRWTFRQADTSKSLLALRAVDTVTHPDWRGQGLFSRLTRELVRKVGEEGISFIFNTPSSQSRPGYLRLGWRVAGRAPLLIRMARPWRLPVQLIAVQLGRAKSRVPDLSGFPRVTELLDGPDTGWLAEALESSGESPPRLSTARSLPYLRWRYQDIPGGPSFEYRSLSRSTGSAHAAVVFRGRSRRGLAEIDVAEIFPGPGGDAKSSVALAADLLRELVKSADADILAAVAAPGTPERLALRKAGFVPARRLAPWVTVLPLEASAGPGLHVDDWRWSLGDLEIF